MRTWVDCPCYRNGTATTICPGSPKERIHNTRRVSLIGHKSNVPLCLVERLFIVHYWKFARCALILRERE